MDKPVVAQRSPFVISVQAGKVYAWCACGRSAKQPFCDGSHKGTEFQPVSFKAEMAGDIYFCGCKNTKHRPLCDGSHKNL